MRVLITGTRDNGPHCQMVGSTLVALWLENDQPNITIVHGDCPTGVDAAAQAFAEAQQIKVERYPANWKDEGKKAGPLRNQRIVNLGADICLAFPRGEGRGTRDCIRRAEAAGIVTKVYEL